MSIVSISMGLSRMGDGCAVFVEVPRRDVKEALREFQGSAGRPEESLPCLGLCLHAVGNHLFTVVCQEHGSKAEVEDVGYIIHKSIAGALV